MGDEQQTQSQQTNNDEGAWQKLEGMVEKIVGKKVDEKWSQHAAVGQQGTSGSQGPQTGTQTEMETGKKPISFIEKLILGAPKE